MSTTPRAITFEARPDGVGVLWLDVPGASQNTIRGGIGAELVEARRRLEAHGCKAAVIASRKPGSFLAGADISGFSGMATAEQASSRARALQAELDAIEGARIPFVAAIDGACLGGGLELALACRARIATDGQKTRLGLPEVKLGLLPAGGGTQRLPRLIGVEAALDLMLTGKHLDGARAQRIGLVAEVVHPAVVVEVAAEWAARLADEPAPSLADRLAGLTDPKALKELALAKNPAGRRLVFEQAERAVREKSGDAYPAPFEILRVTRLGLDKGVKAGLEAEAETFGRLMMGDVSRRLVELFFATIALARDRGTRAEVTPRPVRRVGVLGAGIMGHGIAAVTARQARLPVRLRDRDDEALARGLRAVRAEIEAGAKKRRQRAEDTERVLNRVEGTTDAAGFARCDVVVEAVFEDLALKHQVLAEVEAIAPNAIFASNTSSIPIARIAEAAKRPERVIGMHYFSPVPKMPLLEVIRTPQTSDEVVATCVALGQRQKKTVIVVNDGVGFYTSRILGPYLNEAAWMLLDGLPIETIDAAARAFGFPVGPITLLDEVGIDTAARVSKVAGAEFGSRLEMPGSLDALVADGRTGRKGGRGFYRYDSPTGAKPVDATVYDVIGVHPEAGRRVDLEALGLRLALPMVSEAVRCLEEGILRAPRDGDVGAVLGLGFPPHRGGPFRYADALGPAELLRRIRTLEDRHGRRFGPPELLVQYAATGRRFHG